MALSAQMVIQVAALVVPTGTLILSWMGQRRLVRREEMSERDTKLAECIEARQRIEIVIQELRAENLELMRRLVRLEK